MALRVMKIGELRFSFYGDDLKRYLITALLIFASVAWTYPIDEAKKSDGQVAKLEGYRLAASKGDAMAQWQVGFAYSEGLGVAHDYVEALKWYRLSAAQGYANAQFDLGWFYEIGRGIPQDYAEAAKWYRLAAAQRHVFAFYNLGQMYEHGRGVPKDDVRAHMWFNLAGVGRLTGNSARDNVEKRLTSQQIAEAQKLARECQARNFMAC